MEKYNTQFFDLEDEDGMERAMAFIRMLHEDSRKNSRGYNQILTYVEEGCLIVSWAQIPYEYDVGSFKFVGDDQVIMDELHFPDGYYDYVLPEDKEEKWGEWAKANPEWEKNSWGVWVNTKENHEWEEEIKKNKPSEETEDGV